MMKQRYFKRRYFSLSKEEEIPDSRAGWKEGSLHRIMAYRAPLHLVSVRVPFLVLVFSRACSVSAAWRLSRGALTSPYYQRQILDRVEEWNRMVDRAVVSLSELTRLPFGLLRRI